MMAKGRHASDQGTYRVGKGQSHHGAKLKNAEALKIVEEYRAGAATQRQIAAKYSVCQRTIAKIVRGISYQNA